MPQLAKHQSAQTTKMLLLGNNGSGKSGGLVALAAAGYNVRALDMDNGLDAAANLLNDPRSPYMEVPPERFQYITITDPMKKAPSGTMIPGAAKAWGKAMDQLTRWKDGPELDLGNISDWGPGDVLAIDSLTMLGNAAMNHIKALNNRLGQQAHQSDWYGAQQLLESMFQLIFDESVRCNVIINCHIKWIGEEGREIGYPDCPGKALSPKMGTYFNTILMAKSVGVGALARRKIVTRSQGGVELKTGAPLALAPEYPIETGLADIFAAIRGQPSPKILKKALVEA